MFAIFRGLLRAFGPVPIIVVAIGIYFIAMNSGERTSEHQSAETTQSIAGPTECFGAYVATVDSEDLADIGATAAIRVSSVREGSPAATAGIRPGDFIIAEDGSPVSDRRVWQTREMSGQTVRLTVARLEDAEPRTSSRFDTHVALGVCSVLPSPS